MPVDFGARRKQAEAEGLLGSGDYFKLKEGPNRVRLLSECLPHPGEYKGTKNFKWLCYVLDRRDAKLKPFFMPHTIYKFIESLQTSEDYQFYDVPMPYDITITADGAGTKEVKYAVMPAKKEIPLTAPEQALLDQAKPLAELQEKLREKHAKGEPPHNEQDTHFDPSDYDEPEYSGGGR